VVKANAYGHGLTHAIRALGPVADGFALLDLAEARALREAGLTSPSPCWKASSSRPTWPRSSSLGSPRPSTARAQLTMLEQAGLGNAIDVMLKINSGMNRLGFAGDATFGPPWRACVPSSWVRRSP
jgi:alanine racemase